MKNKEIKIVFFGTPEFVVPVLQSLIKNFDVIGVVTTPDQKVDRKQLLTPSPVNLASQGYTLRSYSLKVFTPEKLDAKVVKKLKDLKPDLFVVAAYGKIIPQNILDIPRFGAINIHPSLLPKYRGPSPIQSAILAGDKISGITIIKMDEKMDHGPILYVEEFSVSSLDNFQTLSTKMFYASSLFLPKIIPAFIEGKLKPRLQDDAIATYCNLIKKESGYFDLKDFSDSPIFLQKLDRMIRAYFPWPTAWTKWQPHQRSSGEAKIIKFYPGGLVQIEGKKAVKLEEFLRGCPNFPIKNLI